MAHIQKITLSKAAISDKQDDSLGAAFLSLWFFVFTWILTGAFSSKDR